MTSSEIRISPLATAEETAAIVAAVDALWPRAGAEDIPDRPRSAWKFSNRWWSQPLPLRRARPWV